MKKIAQNLHSILMAFAAILFLTSCGGDDEVTFALPTLNITAAVGETPVTSGDEVVVGSRISFTVAITAEGGVNGLTVNGTSYSRSQLGAEAGDTEATIIINSDLIAIGNGEFVFQAVDDAGQVSAEQTFIVNVIAQSVETYTQVLLGGFQNSTLGSFYNVVSNTVYTYNDAVTNSASVDLLFYYAATPMYTIAALDNAEADLTLETQTQTGDLDDFPTRNPTRFKTFLTVPDFDAISTVPELETAFNGDAASSDQSRITQLSVGDVFGFTLATDRGSKIGLIKVSAVDDGSGGGSTRAITIEVKVAPTE